MKEPIYSRSDGTYVINHNGYPYHVMQSDELFQEVEVYLLDHPEALVPEPVPPAPTQEELDAREVQSLQAYLDSNDWYASRKIMTGKDIPADVLIECQKARDRISELKGNP